MWPNGVLTAGTPKLAASSGPVLIPREAGSMLLLTTIGFQNRLNPNRASSSVWFESVEFQTTPTSAAVVGSVTELKKSTGWFGDTISPLLPAGDDWKLRP